MRRSRSSQAARNRGRRSRGRRRRVARAASSQPSWTHSRNGVTRHGSTCQWRPGVPGQPSSPIGPRRK
eukprot:7017650-Lingulodinium_polyedra.AAC.1